MFTLFKAINKLQPQIRELDPTTMQRLKEGEYLVKLISEIEVSARKCDYYAGNCFDAEIKNFFTKEIKLLSSAKKLLEDYYESITKEK
ncbi:MAG: hypothetical protein ACYC2T_11760 [Bacillota bacterium]